MIELYNADCYEKLKEIPDGSVCGTLKGFAANPERARLAGQKGGRISKRGKAKK